MTKKISQLPAATSVDTNDEFVINQDGTTKKLTTANQWDFDNVNIDGGSITGITDLAVADGGTGASDASGARTNLGLGTIATQNANGVTITGGNITADALTSGTVPSARIDGNYTGIDQTAAVFSHPTDTGSVTTTHLRAVVASQNSTASGFVSAVVASTGTASGDRSAVVGSRGSTASGSPSAVVGSRESTASGTAGAVVASTGSTASGFVSAVVASSSSTAIGTRSAVVGSLSSEASGNRSAVVASQNSTASGARSAVVASIGTINNVGVSLALGNGSGVLTANRKIHLFGSNGNVSIAGTLTQNATFTDFAEMMPNGTGAEIEAGTLLTMDDGAVRPADEGEEICGVVSHTAAILAGDTPFCWQGRYLHDEFGRRLYEDMLDPDWEAEIEDPDWDGEGDQPMIPNPEPQPTITVLKENPDWNPELEQVTRSERPDEWTPVGLIGQVYVRLGEQVQAGDRITAKGGKGYKTTDRTGLKVMTVTKDYDGDYGIARCLLNVMV